VNSTSHGEYVTLARGWWWEQRQPKIKIFAVVFCQKKKGVAACENWVAGRRTPLQHSQRFSGPHLEAVILLLALLLFSYLLCSCSLTCSTLVLLLTLVRLLALLLFSYSLISTL
jgi:hypothetical protein